MILVVAEKPSVAATIATVLEQPKKVLITYIMINTL